MAKQIAEPTFDRGAWQTGEPSVKSKNGGTARAISGVLKPGSIRAVGERAGFDRSAWMSNHGEKDSPQ